MQLRFAHQRRPNPQSLLHGARRRVRCATCHEHWRSLLGSRAQRLARIEVFQEEEQAAPEPKPKAKKPRPQPRPIIRFSSTAAQARNSVGRYLVRLLDAAGRSQYHCASEVINERKRTGCLISFTFCARKRDSPTGSFKFLRMIRARGVRGWKQLYAPARPQRGTAGFGFARSLCPSGRITWAGHLLVHTSSG